MVCYALKFADSNHITDLLGYRYMGNIRVPCHDDLAVLNIV